MIHPKRNRSPFRRAAMILAPCCSLAACAGSSDAAHRPAAEATTVMPAAAPTVANADATPAETCVAVMHKTRDCAQVYVPSLLALRVRLDLPAGIATRFKAEGEGAMLELAHSQFARDWSDDAITANCNALAAKPATEQQTIITPERDCLAKAECSAFAACDLAHKEKRWTETL
jgi:hypothetical protein